MTKNDGTEHLHAASVACLLYLLAVIPVFCFSLVDLAAEWQAASQGVSTDAPQHAAMGALASVVAYPAFVFFLLAAVASAYVLWRGSRGQRLRVAAWYGMLAAVLVLAAYGPHSRDFPLRVYFVLYQTLIEAPLLILPLIWLWRDRRHYLPSLRTPRA
jgi:hypothetical protein